MFAFSKRIVLTVFLTKQLLISVKPYIQQSNASRLLHLFKVRGKLTRKEIFQTLPLSPKQTLRIVNTFIKFNINEVYSSKPQDMYRLIADLNQPVHFELELQLEEFINLRLSPEIMNRVFNGIHNRK